MSTSVAVGSTNPLGATPINGGVNFSVYADKADAIELALFDHADDAAPSRVIRLDADANRSYHYWHCFVPELRAGQLYAYRALGPNAPERGLRFDPDKFLLDPYGRGVVVPKAYARAASLQPGNNATQAMKSVVANTRAFDWEGDAPLRRPFAQTVMYEMHVRGFTANPNSGVAEGKRGTYAGLVEKIPYLQQLGVTAVELLPVFAFDATTAAEGLTNYWGYQPVSFFAPHAAYSSRQDPLGPLDEFRTMVKALHKAGIEVILDVVYNHTAEGYGGGAMFCFRGLANDAYYILDPDDPSRYADFTGCQNTLNAGHTVVRRMILDSLRYWVNDMHVDGFRFDLASVLTRGERGQPLPNPPIIWDIESDPTLANTKLIAEAWDAAGLYQVGTFVGDAWREWNGKFRDDVRNFVKSDNGRIRALAERLTGSPDVYAANHRPPEQSVNFVTVHDGFTMNDLVSYDAKHNDANGEGNRDGSDDNQSWNCGVEGPTDDADVEALRARQIKNFFALLLLSVGAPLLLMGDEARRTQRGNNNAYCQDNDISWFDWSLPEQHADLVRFVRLLIANRIGAGAGRTDRNTLVEVLQRARLALRGVDGGPPDLGETSHALAASRSSFDGRQHFCLMVNAYWQPLDFVLPPTTDETGGWRRAIDTSLASPEDILAWDEARPVGGDVYRVESRSIVVLVATPTGGQTTSST